jgi:transcription-repair coupling factor (superfamily II helicase)
VRDLSVRLGLYRRIAAITDRAELDALAAELVDRFGRLPAEVQNLLDIIALKTLCKQAGIDKIDSGPKGVVLSFRNNTFPNPEGLVGFISRQSGNAKLRPDHKLVFVRTWEDARHRLEGVQRIVASLADIASGSGPSKSA